MDVTLFQSVAHRGAHEVGMAAGVHVLARHEVARVGDLTWKFPVNSLMRYYLGLPCHQALDSTSRQSCHLILDQ